MRDLTPQEVANAPEWATHYESMPHGVIYQTDGSFQTGTVGGRCKHNGLSGGAKPIPRKELDISGYEFSDGDMDVIIEADGGVFVSVDSDRGIYANLSRNDIIALAKHSKLTAEDLI